ncbi:MAG: 4Fe-4S binding protein [Clostridiales bacterium]|nr:4Fe-4S binding protein [Clostridiales bacterium]
MIKIKDLHKCSSCMACMMSCPQNAIAKAEGTGGIVFPVADRSKCIDCGRCEAVCPYIAGYNKTRIKGGIVGFTKEESIRALSTAGGLFAVLAAHVLARGGLVWGAAYTAEYNVVHICIEDIAELPLVLGKKYALSQLGDSFLRVKEALLQDRLVLFSGTPCQVAGLRNYLGEVYENLLCVEVHCGGAVPAYVWQSYLQSEGCPEYIEFVNRVDGCNKAGIRFIYDENTEKVLARDEIAMHKAIRLGLGISPSCENCIFVKSGSAADITLARYNPAKGEQTEETEEWDPHRQPVSLAVYNTPAGQRVIESILDMLVYRTISIKEIQKQMRGHAKGRQQGENAAEFMKAIENIDFNQALDKYSKTRTANKIHKMLKNLFFN